MQQPPSSASTSASSAPGLNSAKYSPTLGPKKKTGAGAAPLALDGGVAASASSFGSSITKVHSSTSPSGSGSGSGSSSAVLSTAQLSAQFQAAQSNRLRNGGAGASSKAKHVQELMHEQDQQSGTELEAAAAGIHFGFLLYHFVW
jgi:hypothetical protein